MDKAEPRVRTVPDFLDNTPLLELAERLKNLPQEKRQYWLNRLGGKRGIPDIRSKPKVFMVSPTTIGFDNEGKMVPKSRAVRRYRKPSEINYTKNTWSTKSHKELKRLRKLGRK